MNFNCLTYKCTIAVALVFLYAAGIQAQSVQLPQANISSWQIKPATSFPEFPQSGDWITLKANATDPHNNSAYDWRKISYYKAPVTWAKVKRSDVHRLWWQMAIEVPANWQGHRVMVDFSQIQGDAIVYCNGKKVRELLRPGGEVELTDFVAFGKTNELLVYTTRDYHGISRNFEQDLLRYYARHFRREIPMSQWGLGITGPVTMRKLTTPAGISDLYAIPSWKKKTLAIEVQIDAVKVVKQAVFFAIIRDAEGKTVLDFESDPVDLSPRAKTTMIKTNWSHPIGWQLDSPYLYTMQVTLKQAGKTIDQSSKQKFGFREFWADGRDLYINGIKTRLRTSSFVSGKTVPDLAFFNLMGYNFFYSQPNPTSWWQNWAETRLYTKKYLDFADTHGIGLSLPVPGVDHMRGKLLENEALRKAYLNEQQAFVRRYRGHPSVLFWSVGMNTMNPHDAIHPLPLGQRQDYSHPMADVIKLACDSARSVDPNTLAYSHADGNQQDLSTSNLYTNFASLQEREDWPMYWAQKGDMPFCAVEFGNPITANFIKARQVYLSEFMAKFMGDSVYERETADALAGIGDVITSPWRTPKYLPLYMSTYWDFHGKFMDHTNRAWRTYGVSALGYYWDFDVSFGNPPGFNPKREKVFGKYSRYIKKIPMKVPDWVNKNFEIHRRGAQPLLAYIAGSPTHTDKTHAFYVGQKITKQLAFVWDGPGDNNLTASWRATDPGGNVIAYGKQKMNLHAGDIQLHPFTFTAPNVTARTNVQISMTVKQASKLVSQDTFEVQIFPAFSSAKVSQRIAVFDPAGKSLAWIKTLGNDVKAWQPGQSLTGVDLLVMGRQAMATLKTLPYTDVDIRNGLNVLMLQQKPQDWEKMGFNCLETGTRILEPRLVNHPAIKGLSMTDLSYWQGSSNMLPENKPARSYDVRRVARVNNKHVVAPVMFEIPQRVGFTPLVAGEFDMNYSPLLRFADGKGQVLFCSLDLTDRVGVDPVPTQLAYGLLSDHAATPTLEALFVGNAKTQQQYAGLGLPVGLKNASEKLMVVAGDTEKISAEQIKQVALRGGKVLCFNATDDLLKQMGYATQSLSLQKVKQSDALKTLGIGMNLLRWREPIKTIGFALTGQPADVTVWADGLMLLQKRGSGQILFVQVSPDKINTEEPYHTQLATQRLRQLTAQLLTGFGASPQPQLAKRLNTIQSGAKYAWLKHWHVLGPIKAIGNGIEALDTEYPGQKPAIAGDTNPNFYYQQADGSNLDFRKTVMANDTGFVDIASAVNQADGFVAYATRTIDSDTARTAILKIGVDYWADVYLNGKHVYRAINRNGAPRANNMSVKLKLKQGENIITLKVLSGSRGFGFWAGLSEGDIRELEKKQKNQSPSVRLYTPMPHPFDPYEYHYW